MHMQNRFRDALGVLVLLLFPAPFLAAQEPSPRPLFEALARNAVRFVADAKYGFEKIDITVSNLTEEALCLDPAGSVLMPPDPSLQRLGLGAPVDARPDDEASFYIHLAPKGIWSGTVWAVCLDAEKGVPGIGVPYELSARPAAPRALEILRYWARKPWIAQKTVNDLIWTGQDLQVLRTQVIPAWLRKSSLACWGGHLFWLSGEGTLYRRAGEEWVEFGANLQHVFAGHGQVVGTHGSINGVRLRSLTGEGWRFVTLLGVPTAVLPAPGFVLYVIAENRLWRLEPGKGDPVQAAPFEVEAAALGGSPGAAPAVYALERETGKIHARAQDGTWTELSALPARGIAATPGLLYGAFATGVFRFQGKWIKIANEAEALLPSARGCYLVHREGVEFYSEETGKKSALPSLENPTLSLVADPAGDGLYALDESGTLSALGPEGWVQIGKVPGKDE